MLFFYHSEKKSSVSVVSEAEMYNEFLEYLKQELASTDDSVVVSIKKHLKCCMRYTGWQREKAFHTQNNTGASHGNLRPVAQTKACSTIGKGSSKLFKERNVILVFIYFSHRESRKNFKCIQ